jgi:hypothetical protein
MILAGAVTRRVARVGDRDQARDFLERAAMILARSPAVRFFVLSHHQEAIDAPVRLYKSGLDGRTRQRRTPAVAPVA